MQYAVIAAIILAVFYRTLSPSIAGGDRCGTSPMERTAFSSSSSSSSFVHTSEMNSLHAWDLRRVF
jgi:hypothetical protein